MYLALALLLLALGGFTAAVARRVPAGSGTEQLRGFCYVGAVACTAVAVSVVIVGSVAPQGRLAEGVALLGFFGYAVYTLAALVIATWPRRRLRRTIPPVHRRNRSRRG